MYCPLCGKSILDGSSFCSHCGKPINAPPVAAKKSNPLGALWKLFVALILVCGALFLFAYISSSAKKNKLDSAGVMRAILAVPAPVTENVFSGDISIGPGQYQSRTFTIYPEMTQAQLSGSFHAAGGSGNDIQAVVTTSTEFENWINNHPTKVYYSTEKVTAGQIDVRLGPGTYVVAFSNKFSLLTEKEVTADITLHYLRPYQSQPRTSVHPP
jgi:predicted nucleic acid-binding Zn ribbon protein